MRLLLRRHFGFQIAHHELRELIDVMIFKRTIYLASFLLLLTGALYAGYVYLAFNFLTPYEHLRNSEEAERHNAAIWERGYAKIFIVEAQISLDGEPKTDQVEVVYARKVETGYSPWKHPPMVWDLLKSYTRNGRSDLSPSFRISNKFDLSFGYTVNPYRTKVIDPRQTEIVNEISYASANLVREGNPLTICTQFLRKQPVQFGRLTVHPLRIASIRYVKVREIIPRERYGYANRNLQSQLDVQSQRRVTPANSIQFYNNTEKKCWGQLVAGKHVCSKIAEKECIL